MDRVLVTELKGVKLIKLDFSNLKKEEEIDAVMKESEAIIRINTPNSIFSLTNIEGMHFNSRIKEMFAEFTKGNKPYVKAGTVIGLSGLQRIMLNGINKISGRNLKACVDENTAEEWLATQV